LGPRQLGFTDMANLTLNRALDLAHIDFAEYTGGDATPVSPNELDVANDRYTAQIFGSSYFYLGDGTVTSVDAQYKGKDAFHIDGLEVAFSTLSADRDDSDAVLNDLFGGNDAMIGSSGDDGLTGLGGDDLLKGGKGADTLIGGAGADHLVGGKGADHFTFTDAADSAKGASDVISGLSAEDVVDLSAFGITAEDLSMSYRADKDLTTYKVDTNGDGATDLSFTARGDHTGDTHFVF
jgi:Ca2+-binding RTX toxin-like protein